MAVRKTPVILPANSPVLPPVVTQEQAWALKGLMGGDADGGQQTLALNWLLYELTRVHDISYRPDSERDTVFAEGKRHCGIQIRKILEMTPAQIALLPRFGAATQEDDGAIQDR